MIRKRVALLAAVLGLFDEIQAASFVVSPTQSIQSTIDAAVAGDNITVQSGIYNENLTITKALDIRGVGGAVLATGTLSITGVTAPVYIADISFGKLGASGVTVAASSNVRFDRCQLVGGGALTGTGSTLYVYKGTFDQNVDFMGCTWTFQRSTVVGSIASSNSVAKCIASVANSFTHTLGELTIFQSVVTESTQVSLSASQKSWICYNTLRYLQIGGGSSEVVGNVINGRGRNGTFVRVSTGAATNIRNNRMFDDGRNITNNGGTALQVDPDAGLTRFFNNTIRNVWRGVVVTGSPSGVEVRGNIHQGVTYSPNGGGGAAPAVSLSTSYAGTIVANNNFRYSVSGGVQSDNISADALLAADDSLGAGSPSRDAGPPDPTFNDLDGSRNDQGAYGGHSYDPEGSTTLKPVVLSGEASPLYVKRGQPVTIKARAAVAAAP